MSSVGEQVRLGASGIIVSVLESLLDPRAPTVLYELRPDLSPSRVTPSDTFVGIHNGLWADGLVARNLDEERDALAAAEVVRSP